MKFLTKRYIGGFSVGLLGVAVLGLLFPTSGQMADILSWAIRIGIGLLFFLYGARLSTHEVFAGMRHWRLHLTIVTLSFVCFPVLGVTIGMVFGDFLPEDLVAGLVFVTLISATTQTSVSNTVTARGNVPAAIIATSASSVLGVFITPLLVATTLATTGAAHIDLGSVVTIVTQLLVPFLAGQLFHPRIGGVLRRRGRTLMRVDRGLILFVVFAAFSKGSGAGIWGSMSLSHFALLLALCAVLLAAATTLASVAGRVLRFSRDDRAVVMFVGTSKSVAVGLPMATVLFGGDQTALIIVPLMCFFQLQMVVGSFIAQRLGQNAPDDMGREPAPSAPSAANEVLLHSGDDGGLANTFVGALVVDANARPALERFAISARSIDDELQLIQELQSAGMVDRGPDGENMLVTLLTLAGDRPIRLFGFDTGAGRTTGRLCTAEGVERRLQTADPNTAADVSRKLAELPPGKKIAVLMGAPHTSSAGGVDGRQTRIDLQPGDAIYYPLPVYSADTVVDKSPTFATASRREHYDPAKRLRNRSIHFRTQPPTEAHASL